jgi:hypothetical protein
LQLLKLLYMMKSGSWMHWVHTRSWGPWFFKKE